MSLKLSIWEVKADGVYFSAVIGLSMGVLHLCSSPVGSITYW
jgi:hypothetical protein